MRENERKELQAVLSNLIWTTRRENLKCNESSVLAAQISALKKLLGTKK